MQIDQLRAELLVTVTLGLFLLLAVILLASLVGALNVFG